MKTPLRTSYGFLFALYNTESHGRFQGQKMGLRERKNRLKFCEGLQ